MKELARQYGVHRHTVANLLRKANVPLRGQGLTPKQVESCLHLYAQGWSCAHLGERFGCDPKTVWNRLRQADTQLREPWAWMD
jgi:DNA-binding CsgD family transcriptional regulator